MDGRFKLEPILLKGPIAKADGPAVGRALRKWGLNMVRRGDDYPQQLPSGYIRTHKLGQSWTTKGPKTTGRDIEQEAGPNATYGGRVQGYSADAVASADEKQTREMARRNWTPADVMGEEEFDRVRSDIERALNQP